MFFEVIITFELSLIFQTAVFFCLWWLWSIYLLLPNEGGANRSQVVGSSILCYFGNSCDLPFTVNFGNYYGNKEFNHPSCKVKHPLLLGIPSDDVVILLNPLIRLSAYLRLDYPAQATESFTWCAQHGSILQWTLRSWYMEVRRACSYLPRPPPHPPTHRSLNGCIPVRSSVHYQVAHKNNSIA